MLPSEWNTDALLDELLVAPRRAFPTWAGTQVIEGPGWLQIITPSVRRGGLNQVLQSELDEHEADARIDATIAQYRALDLHFRWDVPPHPRPPDLARRLEQRGLAATEVVGMARATQPELDDPPGDITVVEVDDATIDAFARVMAEGWGVDVTPFEPLHRALLDDPARRQTMVLASCAGEPAGIAASVTLERSVYLLGGVVLPQWRGRGVYRALVATRLRHAAARGRSLVTVHALASSSAPLLARLGFVELVRFTSHR